DDFAFRAGDLRRGQSRLARASGNVENAIAGLDSGHFDQPPADLRCGLVHQLLPVVPTLRGGVPVPALTRSKLDGVDLSRFHCKTSSPGRGETVVDRRAQVKL